MTYRTYINNDSHFISNYGAVPPIDDRITPLTLITDEMTPIDDYNATLPSDTASNRRQKQP